MKPEMEAIHHVSFLKEKRCDNERIRKDFGRD